MKKLSIVVPCYNVEKYIDRCVNSLVNQTLSHSEYEIILVDDASADDTWKHITDWEQRFPELIMAIHCDENGKMGKARNIGVSYASGEYIGYTDSDDWVEPDMYKTLLDEAYAGNQDIVVCRSMRDAGNGIIDNPGTGSVKKIYKDMDSKRRELLVTNEMSYVVWDKIIKRDLLLNNNIVFPEGIAYEDIYYGTLLHVYARRIAFVDRIFYHYYVNPKSTVLSKNAEYHKDIMISNMLLYKQLKERGVWDCFHDELELDLLFTWYLGTMKVICLRYEKPPYDMYIQLKNDVLEAMRADSGIALSSLNVDGGASANNFLMQVQADIINAPVNRPTCVETTATGAAYLAGLAVGYWENKEEVISNRSTDQIFLPSVSEDIRLSRIKGWNKAVKYSYGWAKNNDSENE